ncbi:MAG: hypothetical protein JXR86_18080 [Spirochaetales bacterium]|nr:hypothetical protein [Spirochaetales bacterium]
MKKILFLLAVAGLAISCVTTGGGSPAAVDEKNTVAVKEEPAKEIVPGTGEVIFKLDLEDPAIDDLLAPYGTLEPFNRMEIFDNKIEFEGSNGWEAFGFFLNREFDLSEGPILVSMDVLRNASNEHSQIALYFVNQYLVDGDPWTQGDFIRVMQNSLNTSTLVEQSNVDQRGVGIVKMEKPGLWNMGESYRLGLGLDGSKFKVFINDVLVGQGDYDIPLKTGYLHFIDYNSLEGDVDYISDFTVERF